jgi:spore coat polysaccharide biosynthesis protein SpsF
MLRVVVIAQARMGSSRLPGKVLRRAGELTLLEHLARRLRRARTPTELVVATTDRDDDAPLCEAARALGFRVGRGSVDDVLDRYVATLASLGAAPDDVVVRVTADCPLLDPGELDRLVEEFVARRGTADEVDYLTNQAGEVRKIPRGLDVEVFSAGGLERAAREATLLGDREHVTPYFYRVPGRWRTAVSDPSGLELGHLRLTVDTPADLELVEAVVQALGPDASTGAIASFLEEHPEVARLNADIKQKSIASDMEVRASRVAGKLLLGRADAGATIGHGHVNRIGALLDAWAELGGRAALVGQGIGGAMRERLLGEGVAVIDGGDDEFESRIEGADALAVDGYAFGREHQLRWQARRPLLAIDDLAAHEHVADVVVNQILEFDSSRYQTAAHTRLLIGHPYVLLRREFRRAPAAAPSPEQRVIVSFGGTDPANLTVPLVEALLDRLDCRVRLDVIVGRGMSAIARARLDALGSDRLAVHVDVREMAALLLGASLCVSAAGTTVFEAMACSVPVAIVGVADNQRPVIEGVERRAAGVALGWHTSFEPRVAADAIATLLDDPARLAELAGKGRATVDGRGVYRVLDALLDAVDP